ncbi:MAG: hypothetical protein H9855_00050 [Candidatus Acinetobacter avistercoris]|nr:hypothetical protein [Candidatus Acinetobacter avistercoris]
MGEYSESWRHLKSILAGHAACVHDTKIYSYEEQRQAKAFSIFLVHAKLATHMLNRETVEAVLVGALPWPRSSGVPFSGSDIPLSQIEQFGLVSFYAGWCNIHCNLVRDIDSVDSSLVPLIEAVNHLKDICYGKNGCIQPHYACAEGELRQLLQAEFGEHLTVEQLLPDLLLEGGVFSQPPGNQYFSSLISTYLWLNLRVMLSPKEAFSRWMMCFSVNCDWAMPVIFEQLEYEERNGFNEQLLIFLAEDIALAVDIDLYIMQSINEDDFSGRIRPMEIDRELFSHDQDSGSCLNSTVEFPKISLSSLDGIYPAKVSGASNNLGFVVDLHRAGVRGRSELFYSWLLSSTVNASIQIQSQYLNSSGFTEELVKLADSRPILKYILFLILPAYKHSNYIVLLLSHSVTSDVAFYYLAKQTFEHSRNRDTSYVQNLEDGYQKLVCREYIHSVEKEPDFVTRVLSILAVLGDQCAFRSPDFSRGFEYRFLLNLLDTLESPQVVQLALAFADLPVRIECSQYEQSRQHYKYLLGFWFIERLESLGIDPTGATCRALRKSIRGYYGAEFAANLEGLSSLKASAFFATLPWRKLIVETGQCSLLALSNRCEEWKYNLTCDSQHPFNVASAVCQYLQMLMCLGRPTPFTKPLYGVASRVQELVRLFGFGPRGKFVHLFWDAGGGKYDLWEKFCSYSNAFRDELYDEFVNRCVPSIPLDHLFVLLERCTVIRRVRLLHETIGIRQSSASDDLGLTGLEQAFISACDAGLTETATRLLESAKEILAQERFANSKNQNSVRIRKVWQSYEYKWQLLDLYETYKSDAARFQQEADELLIPHKRKESLGQTIEPAHYNECDYFRRQIIAMAFSEHDPANTVQLMEALYRETKRGHHGFILFYGHLKLYAVDQDRTRLQHALAYFLRSAGSIEPEQMSETWVATILDAYRLIDAQDIESFWLRLSAEQHTRLHILTPYCRALITRGDDFTVRKILARYQELNQSTPDDLGIDDLLSALSEVVTDLPSMKEMVQLLNEGSQRSTLQLQKHYAQVLSKDFETYVDIVSPNQQPHEYLKDAVLAVARELVLRKRNLQSGNATKEKPSSGIMWEDLINDWFTSLFDQRMAQARVGFRDQKRGGHSASGKSPGEIDGFITSSDNTRIAIFEAFRLFSLDTTVISQHLNKIAGYDSESLSPVFMVGYCDIKNFSELVSSYCSYVSKQRYAGYTVAEDLPREVTVLCDIDHIWLGTETRRRGRKDIVFYHLLINLHFSLPSGAMLEEGERAS